MDEIPYTGDFEIPQGSVLETSGSKIFFSDLYFFL